MDQQAVNEPRRFTFEDFAGRPPCCEVVRHALCDRLDAAVADSGIVSIVAPAGFGKTTLVAQWAERSDRFVAWVGVGDANDDPAALFGLLFTAVKRFIPSVTERESQIGPAFAAQDVESLIALVANDIALFPEPIVIVFDDYHQAQHPDIHRMVNFGIANMPANCSLIFLSRLEPPLQLGRVRAEGRLTEWGSDHLRFSGADIRDAVLLENVVLEPSECQRVVQWSEGWPAGIRFLASLLGGDARAGDPQAAPDLTRAIGRAMAGIDALFGEVVEVLTPAEQHFLSRTSILDRFTAELAGIITAHHDAEGMIEQIRRQRLFLEATDDAGDWYRYHHLFAGFLRRRLAREFTNAKRQQLHRKAAAWFATAELPVESALHAAAAEDWPGAAAIINRLLPQLLQDFRFDILIQLARQLPDDMLQQEPTILTWYGIALHRVGQYEDGRAAISLMRKRAERTSEAVDLWRLKLLEGQRAFMIDHVQESLEYAAWLQTHGESGDHLLDTFADLLSAAIADFSGDVSVAAERLERVWAAIEERRAPMIQRQAIAIQGRVLQRQGRLSEAVMLLGREVERAEASGSYPEPTVLNRLSDIALQRGDADAAIALARKAIEACAARGMTNTVIYSQVFLANALLVSGRADDAQHVIDQALALAAVPGNETPVRTIRAIAAWHARRRGDFAAVRAWLDSLAEATPADGHHVDDATPFYHVRLCLLDHDYARALDLLRPLRETASAQGRHLHVLFADVQIAIAMLGLGDIDAATDLFESALVRGRPEGLFLCFVQDGQPSIRLLRQVANRDKRNPPAATYAAAILDRLREMGWIGTLTDRPGLATLTDREIDVLEQLALDQSNRDIAETLGVGEWTVKKHITAILRKLGVATRRQAIEIAREQGLSGTSAHPASVHHSRSSTEYFR